MPSGDFEGVLRVDKNVYAQKQNKTNVDDTDDDAITRTMTARTTGPEPILATLWLRTSASS